MPTVAFHTLGCKLNFSETSSVARQFLDAGFERREFEDAADVYVINTCSVTDQANKKCRHTIRQALRMNPQGYVVVIGCYAQLKPREIAEIPGVDLVLGAGDKFRILELAGDFRKEAHACVYNSEIREVSRFVDAYSLGDRTRSFLKIQDGCDYKCSFCTIPLARGRSRSDSLDQILRNAQAIEAAGVQEIVLTGVNLGDYGQDQPQRLIDVLRALDTRTGIPRYRISSIEPNLLSNEIIGFVAESKRFMPHFHIPLQSGDNEILGLMRRRYRAELYAARVAAIKAAMPHACIGADVIVGFPGETEAHFSRTAAFLEALDVSYLHVFTYSERDNTPAASMPGSVPPAERSRRNQVLRMLSEKKRQAFYGQFDGQVRMALFESESEPGWLSGFTDNYIQVAVPWEAGLENRMLPVRLAGPGPAGHVLGIIENQAAPLTAAC
ncbi:MAG: tRNA (N(6)-L-threonylcarbamoyladenosine(37)-C(2))-methylthiotransferase MtaB [Bacteroidia bacterium]|nr:tRNA (N(6)-L-threonylcarbamoyladenosine(37)-C(2))-methylthiotransferase MtaB [Bacteroidia bacterium]